MGEWVRVKAGTGGEQSLAQGRACQDADSSMLGTAAARARALGPFLVASFTLFRFHWFWQIATLLCVHHGAKGLGRTLWPGNAAALELHVLL